MRLNKDSQTFFLNVKCYEFSLTEFKEKEKNTNNCVWGWQPVLADSVGTSVQTCEFHRWKRTSKERRKAQSEKYVKVKFRKLIVFSQMKLWAENNGCGFAIPFPLRRTYADTIVTGSTCRLMFFLYTVINQAIWEVNASIAFSTTKAYVCTPTLCLYRLTCNNTCVVSCWLIEYENIT